MTNKTNKKRLKCENFCKQDYLVEMNKKFKKSCKKYIILYQKPNKLENNLTVKSCKKSFCNKTCKGYDLMGKDMEKKFLKKIKNGFQKTYSSKDVALLKKKGAESGCVHITDYNVQHK